jgi:hypothetical protein
MKNSAGHKCRSVSFATFLRQKIAIYVAIYVWVRCGQKRLHMFMHCCIFFIIYQKLKMCPQIAVDPCYITPMKLLLHVDRRPPRHSKLNGPCLQYFVSNTRISYTNNTRTLKKIGCLGNVPHLIYTTFRELDLLHLIIAEKSVTIFFVLTLALTVWIEVGPFKFYVV